MLNHVILYILGQKRIGSHQQIQTPFLDLIIPTAKLIAFLSPIFSATICMSTRLSRSSLRKIPNVDLPTQPQAGSQSCSPIGLTIRLFSPLLCWLAYLVKSFARFFQPLSTICIAISSLDTVLILLCLYRSLYCYMSSAVKTQVTSLDLHPA